VGVYQGIRPIIARLDVFEVARLTEGIDRPIQLAEPQMNCGVAVTDRADVTFEMPDISRVEAHDGDKKTDVGLGELIANQVVLPNKHLLEPVEGVEERPYRRFIRLLCHREPCLVHAVVHSIIHPLVHRINLAPQPLGVKVERRLVRRQQVVERAVQHPDDLRALVVHDRGRLLVPQDWNCEATIEVGVDAQVDVLDVLRIEDWVRRGSRKRVDVSEGPALIA